MYGAIKRRAKYYLIRNTDPPDQPVQVAATEKRTGTLMGSPTTNCALFVCDQAKDAAAKKSNQISIPDSSHK